MSYPEPIIRTRVVELERMRVMAQGVLSPSVVDSLEFERMQDHLFEGLIYRLRGEVLGKEIGRIVYSFPATPWDHWKREWLPKFGRLGRWYLRRHPVRESAKAYSARAIFPENMMALPKDLGPARFAVLKDGPA